MTHAACKIKKVIDMSILTYVPNNLVKQAKSDAKSFYNLFENLLGDLIVSRKHDTAHLKTFLNPKPAFKYDMYAKFLGYKGFSELTVQSKEFADKEYTPCYLSVEEFKKSKILIADMLKVDKTSESFELFYLDFYKILQASIGVLTVNEKVEFEVEQINFSKIRTTSKENYRLHYTQKGLKTPIFVYMDLYKAQTLLEELEINQRYNEEESKEDFESLFNRYKSDATTQINLPIHRSLGRRMFRGYGKNVIGAKTYNAEYMLSYSLEDGRSNRNGIVIFDMMLNYDQGENLIEKMREVLK